MSTKPMDALLDRLDWEAVPEPASRVLDDPYVTHQGVMYIADHALRVYQLSDGQRVIDADDLESFFS